MVFLKLQAKKNECEVFVHTFINEMLGRKVSLSKGVLNAGCSFCVLQVSSACIAKIAVISFYDFFSDTFLQTFLIFVFNCKLCW